MNLPKTFQVCCAYSTSKALPAVFGIVSAKTHEELLNEARKLITGSRVVASIIHLDSGDQVYFKGEWQATADRHLAK